MILKQPEHRQILHADATVALGSRVICETPHILEPENRVAYAPQQWFGIVNLGTLLVRAAEGSEHLGNERNGGIHLGKIDAIRAELDTVRPDDGRGSWPGTKLSVHDATRLTELGFKAQKFPLLAFEMRGYRALYAEGHGTYVQSGPDKNLRHYVPKYRLPFISDMDAYSRRCLEELWGIQLHRTETRTRTPHVAYGGQKRHVENETGAKLRTKMLTQPFPLTKPLIRKLLAECQK